MESKEFQKQNNICTMHKTYANKSASGITLIALVVTIIVLLILAGVSINLVLGENGIITKANLAKEAQEMAQLKEEAELIKAAGLAESLSKVDGQYGKADLLEDLKNNFEGSTLGTDKITTSDGKYDIIVDDNLNITVEKSGEAENVKSGEIIITSTIREEGEAKYIDLSFQIAGVAPIDEYVEQYMEEGFLDFINYNVYPDKTLVDLENETIAIMDDEEKEDWLTDGVVNDTFKNLLINNIPQVFYLSIGEEITLPYEQSFRIYKYLLDNNVMGSDEKTKSTINNLMQLAYYDMMYCYFCEIIGLEPCYEDEDIENQIVQVLKFNGTFSDLLLAYNMNKTDLESQAESEGLTYGMYLKLMSMQIDEITSLAEINNKVSNGDAFVANPINIYSYQVTEDGTYTFNAELQDGSGRVGEHTVIVEDDETYDPDGWEVAWTCTDGTTWSDQITNDGTTELPTEGVIAKFYNTGNTITPQLPESLGGHQLDAGPEYKIVFEGSGNMGSLDVNEGFSVWHNTPYSYYVTEVIISEGITNIAEDAFFLFVSLEKIKIPETIEDIGAGAFQLCHKLKGSFRIPEEMTSIGDNTFNECCNITEVIIHDGITSIGEYAFDGCKSITNIYIPKDVTYIGRNAFSGTSITEMTIPNGVTAIYYSTFEGCENLKSVTIPNGVTTINEYAFRDCTKLTSIVIPDTVETMLDGVFRGCTELANVKLSSNIDRIGNWAFENCTKLKTITIPDGVTSIGGEAFSGCTALESIEIPDSVTYIANAFKNCTSLTSVTLSNNISSIEGHAFYNCSKLTSITIPNKVSWIYSSAFENCSALTSITIPSEVGHIESSAFKNCSSLKSVTILRTGLFSVGDNAFMGLPTDSTIYVPNTTIKGKFVDGTNYDSSKTTISIK